MDIHVNDILKMKKPHPCGSQEWLVLRVGMDFKLRCQGCGHDLMPAAEAFQPEIHTDTQHLPLLAAARVLFFHGKNVVYLYIHWVHFLFGGQYRYVVLPLFIHSV